jgi:hypothetical protein
MSLHWYISISVHAKIDGWLPASDELYGLLMCAMTYLLVANAVDVMLRST